MYLNYGNPTKVFDQEVRKQHISAFCLKNFIVNPVYRNKFLNTSFKLIRQTTTNNWHVHIDPVTEEAKCGVALGKWQVFLFLV